MGWPAGVGRIALDSVDSTNEEARRLAEAGELGPVWITARRQTLARGRRGRAWAAPAGNLSATCLLRPEAPAAEAALLSFAACLSVADMLGALAPQAGITLKWPNDALLNGRKTAGVLLESASAGRKLAWLAVGVGVNLAHAPRDETDAWPATSLLRETGAAPQPEAALALLACAFAEWSQTLSSEGFAPLRAAWLARAARLGEKVVARMPREEVEGVFVDLDADGALVLMRPLGARRIGAAELFFP